MRQAHLPVVEAAGLGNQGVGEFRTKSDNTGAQGIAQVSQSQNFSTPPPTYARNWNVKAGVHGQQGRPALGGVHHPQAVHGQPGPGVMGAQSGEGFHGMTIQQQLETQYRLIQQQLSVQREEVRLIQQHLRLQQYQVTPPPTTASQAWGYKPSC